MCFYPPLDEGPSPSSLYIIIKRDHFGQSHQSFLQMLCRVRLQGKDGRDPLFPQKIKQIIEIDRS